MGKRLFDIHEVCSMLKTTSRTLRFYEEKRIVASTRLSSTVRRQYTQEQIVQIRNVLALRMLGLSVKDIQDLQEENTDLKSAILARRARIYALIEAKNREINLLNEAVSALETGGDLFCRDIMKQYSESNFAYLGIARKCAEAIVSGKTEALYEYLGMKLREYMPQNVYKAVRRDVLEPLGAFVEFDFIETDQKYENIIYQYVKYEKLGLKIKFVFHSGYIDGLWLDYYKL